MHCRHIHASTVSEVQLQAAQDLMRQLRHTEYTAPSVTHYTLHTAYIAKVQGVQGDLRCRIFCTFELHSPKPRSRCTCTAWIDTCWAQSAADCAPAIVVGGTGTQWRPRLPPPEQDPPCTMTDYSGTRVQEGQGPDLHSTQLPAPDLGPSLLLAEHPEAEWKAERHAGL